MAIYLGGEGKEVGCCCEFRLGKAARGSADAGVRAMCEISSSDRVCSMVEHTFIIRTLLARHSIPRAVAAPISAVADVLRERNARARP
jgi:hypothetical protein